jgi:hypothetical protein
MRRGFGSYRFFLAESWELEKLRWSLKFRSGWDGVDVRAPAVRTAKWGRGGRSSFSGWDRTQFPGKGPFLLGPPPSGRSPPQGGQRLGKPAQAKRHLLTTARTTRGDCAGAAPRSPGVSSPPCSPAHLPQSFSVVLFCRTVKA